MVFPDLIQSIDVSILVWIENFRNTFCPEILNTIVSTFTNLGEPGLPWFIITIILLCRKKTRRAGVVSLLALAVSWAIGELVLKHIFMRPRPFVTEPDLIHPWAETISDKEGILNKLNTLIHYGLMPSSSSFPSGHACSSIGFATGFCGSVKNVPARIFVAILAILMALSRLYICVHYPSDVLVGTIIGIIGGIVVCLVANRITGRPETEYKGKRLAK